MDENKTESEYALLRELALKHFKERRAARRWNIFFRLLTFVVAGVVIWSMWKPVTVENLQGPHTAMVEINGVIAEGTDASSAIINDLLNEAFRDKHAKGVILKINSPGGTPVQAAQINSEVTRLRGLYPNKPMHVVVSDLCASGGYYVAAAADQIFAAEASMVGSIGVRLDSFGLTGAMEKLGVERRTITAGEHKAMLDPFAPQSIEGRAHMQGMLNDVHQQFIDAVKAGRGDRLANEPDLFSGLVWSGRQAKELGLIDSFGDEHYVAREVIGADNIITHAPARTLLEELTRGAAVSLVKAWQELNPRIQM